MKIKLQDKLKQLPDLPGCYLFKDRNNKIIYVGKAKNIKKRVSSYFYSIVTSVKIQSMIPNITDIQIQTVKTETDALILETNLIKKYSPKYNKLMKDDKSYLWIRIDLKEKYPKINFIRDYDKKNDNASYFGPFPYSKSVYIIMAGLRKLYPYRSCNLKLNGKEVGYKRSCLYYDLKLCNAPCDNLVNSKDYLSNIKKIESILKGNSGKLKKMYTKEMTQFADEEKFEEAIEIKRNIQRLNYITQKITLIKDEEELPETKQLNLKNTLNEIASILNIKYPIKEFRIECYDISNISGSNPVGSMVVFVDGEPKKSDYRRFKIRTVKGINDFAMMKEVVQRRLSYLKSHPPSIDKSLSSIPSLIIVDGGKGQLAYAIQAANELGINIKIVSLAKREELVFQYDKKYPVRFQHNALFLLQRIRDEAHRFAVSYHRLSRSKTELTSMLDYIKGIGPKTRTKLFKKYTTIENMKTADQEDLKSIVKNKKVLEELITNLKTNNINQNNNP